MSARVYPSARSRILDAAERVLVRDGLGRLSVDAVLAEAEVSKGGFFHHFATRDHLLAAVTTRLSQHIGARIKATTAKHRRSRGAALRAQINLAFRMPRRERVRLQALMLALVEAACSSAAVAARARRINDRSIAEGVADGVSAANVLLIQLALDGYWLAESLGTLTLSAKRCAALHSALVRLTR